MKTMRVRSAIKLSVPAEKRHVEVARRAAERLTTDKTAVTVGIADGDKNLIVTEFPVPKAPQIDVCDRIFKTMAREMEDYLDQTLVFPKSETERRSARRKLERAKERRRLARLVREGVGKQN